MVDLWYLSPGEWDVERMASMRFDPELLWSNQRLSEVVDLTQSPRLKRALRAWREYAFDQRGFEEISG